MGELVKGVAVSSSTLPVGLRRWMLATRDAHGLYAQYGFAALKHPEIVMEISRPDIYRTGNN